MAHREEERGTRRGPPVPAVLTWDFETEAVAESSRIWAELPPDP
jgi:hypothetical protein